MDRKVTNKGITILELLIVLGMMAILLTMGVPLYSKWKAKYDEEKDIKEIYSLLNEARLKSFTEKVTCGLNFGSSSFNQVFLNCDSDDDGDITDSGGYITVKTISLKRKYVSSASSYVKFSRGIAVNFINIHPESNNTTSNENCITISLTKIQIGAWDGTSCN